MTTHPANASAIFQYSGINQFLPLCHPHRTRAFFARNDEPAVADDIGRENGHGPPLCLLASQTGLPVIAWRAPSDFSLRCRTPDRCDENIVTDAQFPCRGDTSGFATTQRPPLGRTKHWIVPASMKR